ncbi:MAG: elongation factor P [Patescibacteria group bacterium]|nr:elongation factor P [Patescibacteria group bacterium]
MLSYNELKVGILFTKDDSPYEVLEYTYMRMQQRKPVAQLKIKNLITGKVLNYTAHQNKSFKEADIEVNPVQFIYHHNNEYWFHEAGKPQNRFSLKDDVLGNAVKYLKPNAEIKAFKFNGKIINVELPIKVDLKVTEAPPTIRGATAAGGTKAVILETGAKVNAPLFINEGDVVRVNTKTGEYAERVEKV